jgi:hypothetical protein
MYLDQVRSSVETGRVVQGIKGRTFLSDLITLPRACVLEYMHLSLEGTVKFLLDLYLNTNNHASNFYLRNSIVHMEHLLAQIKFTSSFSRTQRSLFYYNTFKASEYRNLAFYSLIYILKGTMLDQYYNHILKYLLFLRILNKDKITANEIDYSQNLINEFVTDYETLYGTLNLKYNLHAHLHLPKMAADLGPLYKYAGFRRKLDGLTASSLKL